MGITTMSPYFADVRVITHGAESHANGLDPLAENPADPWQRKMNYPRVWQLLFALGINESHTTLFGFILIVSFWTGVCLLLPNASNGKLALALAAAASPASLLGMERGNIDLIIFFLMVLSIWLMQRSAKAGLITLFSAFVLKLYPVFAWVTLLRIEKSRFRKSVWLMSGFAALYLAVTIHDILLIVASTPKGSFFSYGMNVFWMATAEKSPELGATWHLLSWILVVLVAVISIACFWRKEAASENPIAPMELDAFRAGAGIYLGTFLLGNNWDYRLIFLILTLPQLLWWTRSKGLIQYLASTSIIAILISHWHLIIIKLFFDYGDNYHTALVLDELANWISFGALACLLSLSAPAWVRESIKQLSALFPQTKPTSL